MLLGCISYIIVMFQSNSKKLKMLDKWQMVRSYFSLAFLKGVIISATKNVYILKP